MPMPFLPPFMPQGVEGVMPDQASPQMPMPAPQGPMLPPPQQIVSQDPKQQLLTIATLGAMLGAGPRSGIGTGMAHGTIDAQRYMQSLADAHQHTAFAQQEYIQQQQDRMRAEQEHRQQQIAGVVQNLQAQGRKAKDIDEWQRIATDGATFLSSMGMRGPLTTPQGVAQAMGTFVPPDQSEKFVEAWDGWMKNESNKALLEADPSKAMLADVRVNVGTKAKPVYQSMPLHEVADRAGHGFAEINGKMVALPKKAATGQYQRDTVMVDGKPQDVLINPQPGADSHVFGLDGVAIDPKRVTHWEKPPAPKEKSDKLIKVEHRDPETGKTVIEWLPESQVKGQKFEKGASATTETRLAQAQSVNQTGDDIIKKLSDPSIASVVGPYLGRSNTLRDFIGNPPPEFSELAGQIESYALANMGVHGMRSAQGAQQITKLLDQHHTPESLIAAIQGLNGFSQHFLENAGRKDTSSKGTATTTTSGDVVHWGKDANGNPVRLP